MSTPTSESIPPTKRGRGRPKKAAEDKNTMGEGKVEVTATRKASMKAAGAAAAGKGIKAVKAQGGAGEGTVKKVAKSAASAVKSTVKKTAAKVTPETSKILQEVAKKGGLQAAAAQTPSTPSTALPAANTKAHPHTPSLSTSKPTPSASTTSKPASPVSKAPISAQPPSGKPLAFRAPPPPKPIEPPMFHPDPNLPKPLIGEAKARRLSPYDGQEMPKKYKGAARKVTAMIVGIPILIVTSYELWRRFTSDGQQIRKKYVEDNPLPKFNPSTGRLETAGSAVPATPADTNPKTA